METNLITSHTFKSKPIAKTGNNLEEPPKKRLERKPNKPLSTKETCDEANSLILIQEGQNEVVIDSPGEDLTPITISKYLKRKRKDKLSASSELPENSTVITENSTKSHPRKRKAMVSCIITVFLFPFNLVSLAELS